MKNRNDNQTGEPGPVRRKPGRPRKYASAAERYAAYVARLKARRLRRTAVIVPVAEESKGEQ